VPRALSFGNSRRYFRRSGGLGRWARFNLVNGSVKTTMNASAISIQRLSSLAQLAPLGDGWNELARGVPFRRFEWLESWWRAYGKRSDEELCVVAAHDSGGALVGLAPWYLARTVGERYSLRFLGSGEVCSDYLSVLCRPGREGDVTLALAEWLCAATTDPTADRPRWELLELGGADEHDLVVRDLLMHLAAHGNLVHRRSRASCWRVNLPSDWNGYLAMLSKSHRKQVRRLERKFFDTGRARLHVVETEHELQYGLEALVCLHQRRWESLGRRGCFSSTRFTNFYAESAARLLRSGNLRLVWLDVDGRTVAAEYQVLGNGVVYAYQSGIEPEALEHEPGRLITLATMRLAIDEGRRAFDFLRGDESYKAHWRAYPRPAQEIRVVADTAGARLRHNLWLAGDNVKSWIKNGLRLSGMAQE
jgi:CelD/BcsL family acetyltransferase involved in cellulose biosynthesis